MPGQAMHEDNIAGSNLRADHRPIAEFCGINVPGTSQIPKGMCPGIKKHASIIPVRRGERNKKGSFIGPPDIIAKILMQKYRPARMVVFHQKAPVVNAEIGAMDFFCKAQQMRRVNDINEFLDIIAACFEDTFSFPNGDRMGGFNQAIS